MVTLDDVARLSGVSRSTASRVLNDDPRVSPAARERVREAVRHLGYRPNRAARSLATGRSGVVGLVMPVQELWDDPYGAHVVQAACTAAAGRGVGLMTWLTHEAPAGAAEEILRNGIVEGLVVSALAQHDSWVEELLDGPLPCVLIGRHPTRTDVSWVDVDHRGGATALMDHLVGLGRRRIATITGPLDRYDASERAAAYRDARERHRLPADERLVEHGDFSAAGGHAAMRRLLPLQPDAVLAGNDEMADGAVAAVLDAGLRVPEDVAVTGFDDLRPLRRRPLALTTARHDVEGLSHAALRLLLDLLDGATAPLHEVLPAPITVRASTVRTTSAS